MSAPEDSVTFQEPGSRSRYRAALTECYQDGIGEWRAVEIRENTLTLFREVVPGIIESAKIIYDHHWEWFNVNFDEIRDEIEEYRGRPVGEDERPVSVILDHIRALARDDESQMEASGEDRSILGYWHEKLTWCNECFCQGDYVQVSLEGPLRQFARALLSHEARSHDPTTLPSGAEAQWLGKLAVFASLKRWQWEQAQTVKAFLALAHEFNDANEFH